MKTLEEANSILGTNYKNWVDVSSHRYLSEDFIREFKEEVDWRRISAYQKLSEDFIREFKDKVVWLWIVINQNLSEDFIREFKDRVGWVVVSAYQKLSEDFIREFKDKVSWFEISTSQKLSEDFIREFKDKVYWGCISEYQKLSENFIREFKDEVDWVSISKFQKLSEDFAKAFEYKVRWGFIEDSWHYKDTEFKKQQVVSTGLYECHDDYFIAYKGIRSDRWSYYNFQYKYEKGGVYESWCDCSHEGNSFGLSVCTREQAEKYCDELVVKVKIRYEDVGRIVHKGGNIRCFKIEILD